MDPGRYLRIFIEESREHLDGARRSVDALRRADSVEADVRALFRHLHSLKGMAASLGFAATRDLAHAVEDLLDSIRRGERVADDATLDLLDGSLEALDRLVERVETCGGEEGVEGGERLIAALRARPAPTPQSDVPSPRDDAAPKAWWVEIEVIDGVALPAVGAATALGRLAESGRVLRSDPPLALLRTGRFTGPLRVLVESDAPRAAIAAAIEEVDGVVCRSIVPAPAPEGPPRGGASPGERWIRVRADVLDGMLETLLELLTLHARQARSAQSAPGTERSGTLLKSLYNDLTELRLVSFDSLAWRIDRAVRGLENELGKRAAVTLSGGGVRVDRTVLETLLDPLLHLVRNALDHGIEPPGERRANGKPPLGNLSVSVARSGESLRISVEDDGRGLDPGALRSAAVARGLVAASEAARLSDDDALRLATLPGVSTAPARGTVSGRGVGLDVVVSEVERLGGRLAIGRGAAGGTRFDVDLPLTVVLVRALLVRASGELFAVPLQALERTVRLGGPAAPRSALTLDDGRSVPVISVADRMGLPGSPPPPEAGFALVHPTPRGSVALTVDAVLGRRDVVVRPLGPPLDAVREYAGAALLEDGEIVLVLDPWRLAEDSAPAGC